MLSSGVSLFSLSQTGFVWCNPLARSAGLIFKNFEAQKSELPKFLRIIRFFEGFLGLHTLELVLGNLKVTLEILHAHSSVTTP